MPRRSSRERPMTSTSTERNDYRGKAEIRRPRHQGQQREWQVEGQLNILIHSVCRPLISALLRQRNHAAYPCFELLPADRPRPRDYPMRHRELLFFLGNAMIVARTLW